MIVYTENRLLQEASQCKDFFKFEKQQLANV